MKLTEVKPGVKVRILKVERKGVCSRLALHGLFVGDTVYLRQIAPWGGPLLLDVGGRQVAIGRGIAEKIEVEPLVCESR